MTGTRPIGMDTDHPFTIPVPVRFRDLDPLGHVNNAVHTKSKAETHDFTVGAKVAESSFWLSVTNLWYDPHNGGETAVSCCFYAAVHRGRLGHETEWEVSERGLR